MEDFRIVVLLGRTRATVQGIGPSVKVLSHNLRILDTDRENILSAFVENTIASVRLIPSLETLFFF